MDGWTESPLDRNWLVGTKMSVVVVAGASEKVTKGGRKDQEKWMVAPRRLAARLEERRRFLVFAGGVPPVARSVYW